LGIRDPAEPLGADSEVGPAVVERRLPTYGPHAGQTRTVLDPLNSDEMDATQESSPMYDELADHAKESEQRNTVQAWQETGRSDLPTAGDQPRVSDDE
jgi:hypothetical protein